MAGARAILLLAVASLAAAAQLTVSIAPSPLLDNPHTLPASTHAVLRGPPGTKYHAPLRRDNTFVFADLAEASYLLTVHARDFFFPPLRVDVAPAQNLSAWQTFRGNEWSHKGPRLATGRGQLALDLRVAARKDFYQPRGGFSVLAFLKSPMVLMGLVSAAMIFGLPYLMDNMDDEAKAELAEMSKKSPLTGSGGAASQVQNFDLAAFLAGRRPHPPSDPPPASSSGGSTKP